MGSLLYKLIMIKPTIIDSQNQCEIMSPEEVSRFLRKSTSWVYKNWKELGGRKLGGSLFFPGKENLYEYIFNQGHGMEIRLHPQRDTAVKSRIQDQDIGKKSRGKKKGGTGKTKEGNEDQNRHGLFGIAKPKT